MVFILLLALHSSSLWFVGNAVNQNRKLMQLKNKGTERKDCFLSRSVPDPTHCAVVSASTCTRSTKGRSDSGTTPSGNNPLLSQLKSMVKTPSCSLWTTTALDKLADIFNSPRYYLFLQTLPAILQKDYWLKIGKRSVLQRTYISHQDDIIYCNISISVYCDY